MRLSRGIATGVLSVGLVLASAAPALAAPTNPKALENCYAAIEKQIEKGVSAGGGPKEGVLGPSNCDGFFHFH